MLRTVALLPCSYVALFLMTLCIVFVESLPLGDPALCPPGSACPSNDLEHFIEEGQRTNNTRMFIAIFTAPQYVERRTSVRKTWLVPRDVTYEFVLCEHTNSTAVEHLRGESIDYGDIMWLPCEEGYGNGKLVRKTTAAMRAFHDNFPGVPFFFKTDDDTYPKINKLLLEVESAKAEHLYAGKLYPGGRVHRDKQDPWYDPIFLGSQYPAAMAGGPGYVLSATLVKYLLEQGIEDGTIPSYAEDKAIAIWIQRYDELKNRTRWLDIPAQDGYNDSKVEGGTVLGGLISQRKTGITIPRWKGEPY
eukprot:gnl/TRDRNA2_/TRDRNA2_29711_c0_seq1.p1 gnl/TRDRNA2_/TRDRNA2_29711_c0~~gnl/TRDRNA2_/TRDRNA2_29711_c0_seq1.p1  ORF type:complete len:304 (-),score=4.24 gnl/TRDRNA2_/TRDRNA2_29711_c0_seq1:50-961(-)